MSLNFKTKRGLHFVHLNIRSLLNKYDQTRQLLHDSNISILGISESWLNQNIDEGILDIPNYSCIRLDRGWSKNTVSIKKGGGICCYIKNDIIFSDSEFAKHNISNRNMEMQIISINQPHVKKIAFINLYRPPQGNVTMFCDMLHDTIVSLNASTTHEIFVLGDFNINYTNSTSPG